MVSAEEPGEILVQFSDSAEHSPVNIAYFSTAIHGGAAKAYPTGATLTAFPYQPSSPYVNEGGRVIVKFKSNAADIIESEESQGELGVILKNKNTGAMHKKILHWGDTLGDFTNFASTADVSVNTLEFVKCGYYTVPTGYLLKLDPDFKAHFYAGDDTA